MITQSSSRRANRGFILRAALVPLALTWPLTAMSASPLSQTRSFRIDAPCARVFPLFTPVGERAWAPGWDPEMLSGHEERGSVFRTRAHGAETLWIVAAYEPEHGRVSYARLKHGSNFGLVDVECRDVGTVSEVAVRYTLTGITHEGEAFVREFLAPNHYDAFIREWQRALTDALASSVDTAR
jgi:hypothetical protein